MGSIRTRRICSWREVGNDERVGYSELEKNTVSLWHTVSQGSVECSEGIEAVGIEQGGG